MRPWPKGDQQRFKGASREPKILLTSGFKVERKEHTLDDTCIPFMIEGLLFLNSGVIPENLAQNPFPSLP